MHAHSLSVARQYVATAIDNLENSRAILQMVGATVQAEELARTISIVSMDLRLITNAWREAKSEETERSV